MGQHMGAHVVHRNRRHAQRPSIGLGERRPDVKRPLKSWPQGVRHRIQFLCGHLGLVQRSLHHGVNLLEVRPRRPFWHHAAHLSVECLVGHDIAEHLRTANHGGRRVVARGLDAQNQRFVRMCHGRPKITARFLQKLSSTCPAFP